MRRAARTARVRSLETRAEVPRTTQAGARPYEVFLPGKKSGVPRAGHFGVRHVKSANEKKNRRCEIASKTRNFNRHRSNENNKSESPSLASVLAAVSHCAARRCRSVAGRPRRRAPRTGRWPVDRGVVLCVPGRPTMPRDRVGEVPCECFVRFAFFFIARAMRFTTFFSGDRGAQMRQEPKKLSGAKEFCTTYKTTLSKTIDRTTRAIYSISEQNGSV